MPEDTDRRRRTPRQERSKEMVEAIVQAGLLVLREEGAEALTTKRIAERAGVSVGSLYQYFTDKEDVLESVYRQQHEEFWDEAALWVPKLAVLPLEKAIGLIVDAGIRRHQQLFEMHPDFYREHAARYQLSTFHPRGGDRATRWVAMILECHADELSMPSPDRAAYLMLRALGGVLISALRDRPEELSSPQLREDLVRMLVALVCAPAPAAEGT